MEYVRFNFSASIADAKRAVEALESEEAIQFMNNFLNCMIQCFESGGKLLIAGNGGSLCDAMHFAEELSGFYREKRSPLPAIALSDPAHMSCVANDVGFSQVFSRQVEALGKPKDLFIALSTSGNSLNLIEAAKVAKEKGLSVIGFLGKGGGSLKEHCDLYWSVEGFIYSDRIQEAHMAAIHMLIEALESSYLYQSAT